MNDADDFEDWSHPSRRRTLSMPPRHGTVRWWRLLALAIACLLFWGAWHVGFMIRDAYRVVFGS